MSLPVVFRGAATAELQDAHDWYEQQSPGLGVSLEAAVQVLRDEIEANPKRYPIVFRDVREAPVTGFPYCVYYAIEPTHILVIAVFHTSRHPAVWKRRRNAP